MIQRGCNDIKIVYISNFSQFRSMGGVIENQFFPKFKKSKRGGSGQGQNQKSQHFKCRLTLTEFFRFFPNSNNWNMTFLACLLPSCVPAAFLDFNDIWDYYWWDICNIRYIYGLYMNKIFSIISLIWFMTRLGPWSVGYTWSRKISEVKQHLVVLVVGWVTAWEQA